MLTREEYQDYARIKTKGLAFIDEN